MIHLWLACTLSSVDLDGDGSSTPEDCDDRDHTLHPGAADPPYDGIDQNCDGVDEFDLDGDGVAWPEDCDDAEPEVGAADELFVDADGDGWGDPEVRATTCGQANAVRAGRDCDDADPDLHPRPGDSNPPSEVGDHGEICGDGIDQNCNGSPDGCDLVGEFSAEEADLVLEQAERGGFALGFVADLGGPDAAGFASGAPGTSASGLGEVALVWGDFRAGPDRLTQATFRPAGAGDSSFQDIGWSISGVPDVDADGAAEVAVAAPYAEEHRGVVWLVPGGRGGDLDERDALWSLTGWGTLGDPADLPSEVGAGLAGGDVDGDGFSDLFVGVQSATTCGDRPEGATYLFRGPLVGSADPAQAAAVLRGAACGDASGNEIALAGDLDGDGLEDLAVGALNHDGGGTDAGAAFLVYAPFDGTRSLADAEIAIVGETGYDGLSDGFGSAVASGGDTDGDGHNDLVIGAYGADTDGCDACGAMYVFTGPGFPAEAEDAAGRVYGDGDQNFLGRTVAGGGDVDADGHDDVLGGAPNGAHEQESLTGRVVLALGPVQGTTVAGVASGRFYGAHALDRLGVGLALGDLDADGHDDVALGADAGVVGINNEPGWVVMFFGGSI